MQMKEVKYTIRDSQELIVFDENFAEQLGENSVADQSGSSSLRGLIEIHEREESSLVTFRDPSAIAVEFETEQKNDPSIE